MSYDANNYDNLEALRASGDYPELVAALVDSEGEGAWADDMLTVYPSVSDYGIREYENLVGIHLPSAIRNWTLDPSHYINWDEYGQSILEGCGTRYVFEHNGQVVTSEHGW